MLRTIIIEDEIASQKLLKVIIDDYCPQLSLVGIASNVQEGRQMIASSSPDLIFLDIELQGRTGFDLLDSIDLKSAKIIFTTAYDQYAVKAFKYQAIDYILKPYSPNEIIAAVIKIKESQYNEEIYEQLKIMIEERNGHAVNQKLEVNILEGVRMIDYDEIIRIEANGSYSTIQLAARMSVVVSKLIKELETQLPIDQFYRVHKTHLINLNYVEAFMHEDGGFILLSNNEQIPVARRRKDDFLNQLSKYNIT